ncbi:NAD-dependent epimerase/dehydratase family protein [bacterium]|nr:NAD-dependent epimerase/dehydratase family protein [bacterium]
MSAPARWLITGGCGFIGTNLIERLLADGKQVRVFDNLTVGSRDSLGAISKFAEVTDGAEWSSGVQLMVGDIREAAEVREAARGAEVIVHLAASTGVPQSVEDPMHDCTSNVIGVLNTLEAARQESVKRFIFASSGAPAGEVEPPIHEEVVPKPVSPYGASKLAGEAYCSAYSRTFGVECVALRFGNVYGPKSGHKTSVVAKWINRAMEGLQLEIYGDGTATRDFIFVGDLVDAVVKAGVASAESVAGEIFQIATSRETTVGEVAETIRTALKRFGIDVPEVVYEAVRLGDVHRNYSDTSKARSQLGWTAMTGLAEGIGITVESSLARIDGETPSRDQAAMHDARRRQG